MSNSSRRAISSARLQWETDIEHADFVSRIGISQSYLFAVEHGRNEVGAEVLFAISRAYGKSLEWLLTGEE